MNQARVSKDYWPELLNLANSQGIIKAPDKKSLDEYLRKKLSLSKPTINSLLATWEEEGKIRLKKQVLTNKLVRLQILQIKLGRGVLLVDWENLTVNLGWKKEFTPESVSQGFLKLKEQIGQEMGEIVSVYVFAPSHLASSTVWEKTFYELKFPVIICPKVTDEKEGGERDTVDEILIREGRKLIKNMNLSHLCVASGDGDYVPFYQDAIAMGLKTVTIYASDDSLARELMKVSDKIILFPLIE